jgi:hypothetical protein
MVRPNRQYDRMHAHCILGNEGYKHTFVLCNTYYFSTEIMVMRTRLNVSCLVVLV